MRNFATLLAPFLLSSPALAADAVQQVAMGQTLSGDAVKIAVWTSSGPATPEGVQLQLTAFPGSPALSDGVAELAASSATEQLWTVADLALEGDAHGDAYTVRVSMWDDQAGLVDTVDLPVTASSLTCGGDHTWGGFGHAHAHLDLDDSGTKGRLGVTVAGPETARVATVSVELTAAPDAVAPEQTRHAARLDTVKQLWTRSLPSDARPGDRYQVDAIVLDGQNRGYGAAFVAQLPVAARAPMMRGSCPWPPDDDARLAVR